MLKDLISACINYARTLVFLSHLKTRLVGVVPMELARLTGMILLIKLLYDDFDLSKTTFQS